MSFVDCTSSLLYLPFIANFKEQYVISYMIGAGLSGPIPGTLALAQGVGGYTECINITVVNVTEFGNETHNVLEPYYPPPRFSVNIFFIILSFQMLISWIAFILLNKLPQAKRERVSLKYNICYLLGTFSPFCVGCFHKNEICEMFIW